MNASRSSDPSDFLLPAVQHAMREASAVLARLGVPHAVAGGIAIAMHGYPRSTQDVHFLVTDQAYEHHPGGIVTMLPGVPIQVAGVLIDYLSIGPDEAHLLAAVSTNAGTVLEVNALIYLKLKAHRLKDRVDVVELLKSGVDELAARAYLVAHAPALLPRFEEAVRTASEEAP